MLNFGIIGTNFVTDWLLEAGREEPRFRAVAVCSRQRETGEAFAVRHGIPHVFTSPEEMAASPLIDAVYIASPNALHAEQSLLFMKQGKHVLCEKPLASNAREARMMIDTARHYGVVLMEAMKSTLHPHFGILRQYLEEIGPIRRYFASYGQYSSRYDQLKAGTVLNAFRPELSNGATMDLGIYTIYPMVVLFGRPQQIQACGVKLPTGVDGQGAVNFSYGNFQATVLYSKIADSFLPAEIQGEKGTLVIDRIQSPRQIRLIYRNGQEKDLSLPLTHHEYYYEIAEFISLVENGCMESEVNSSTHSLTCMEIIDEVRRQLGVVYPADHQ